MLFYFKIIKGKIIFFNNLHTFFGAIKWTRGAKLHHPFSSGVQPPRGCL